ncbi:hypothetical protein P7K49_011649 [Saguinus oedipus]|uniref:Transmembrane protein 106A n=1 Tax=Saguinus oedipus TaxID=9490 RepID=A0ABQ9VR94_SAGOE|nr:hypothetical protein P7K49_011649 [Saguinus oedipus]
MYPGISLALRGGQGPYYPHSPVRHIRSPRTPEGGRRRFSSPPPPTQPTLPLEALLPKDTLLKYRPYAAEEPGIPELNQENENKSILSSNPTVGSKAASYSSTSSSKSFCSRVPCEGTAGASFVTCPTCQGSGRIPQELEKQLVALIPYGDQRLKPKHTKLFVFLTVLICLVTSSFVIFFLFPRSIHVQPAGLNSSTVAFGESDIHLNITNVLNIFNGNYYPITVTQLTLEVLHLSIVVGQVSNNLLLRIGPLASEQVTLLSLACPAHQSVDVCW